LIKIIDLSKPMNGTIKGFSKHKVLILWANQVEQVVSLSQLEQHEGYISIKIKGGHK